MEFFCQRRAFWRWGNFNVMLESISFSFNVEEIKFVRKEVQLTM
jgi:hypothetical protein